LNGAQATKISGNLPFGTESRVVGLFLSRQLYRHRLLSFTEPLVMLRSG
jgi:hypothetical protein